MEWFGSLPPVQGPAPRDGPDDSSPNNQAIILPMEIPQGPPRNWDRGAMIKRIRVGMMIELSTIPLYLYSMYSVKPTQAGVKVRATLRGVLQQEMLHLALAGNLLSAVGGSLSLYDPRVVPQYPGFALLCKIPLHLEALNTESLGYFMQLESASEGYSSSGPEDRKVLGSQYSSIGALYEDLITGVRGLPDEKFANNPDKQFAGNDFFGDQLFAITNQATALQALRTIIEQGEGNLRVEDSHYDVFSQLYSGQDSWEVYPVPNDPTTAGYEGYIYKLSVAFDAAYCYLLQTIQRVWRTSNDFLRRVLFRNIHSLMSNVLTPLAEIFVQHKWKDGFAAPCFNYYPMITVDKKLVPSPIPLEPEELHKKLNEEMDAAVNAAAGDEKFKLKKIKCYIYENIKPYQ